MDPAYDGHSYLASDDSDIEETGERLPRGGHPLTFRVFRCGHLTTRKEREQLDQLVRALQKEFIQSREDVRLVIDINTNCQIDGLIFKDGALVVIELKNVGGAGWTVLADHDPARHWRLINAQGQQTELLHENPFGQAKRHRRRFINFVWNRVLGEGAPCLWDNPIWRQVSAWVVVNPATVIEHINQGVSETYWFQVLPLDNVPRALAMEGGASFPEPVLTEEHFDQLLDALDGEEVTPSQWMRLGDLAQIESLGSTTRIPRVDYLLSTARADRVLEALRYVRELNLRDYEGQVYDALSHEHRRVRHAAADILLTWESSKHCDILGRLLIDESSDLVEFALENLSEWPCPDLVPELLPILDHESTGLAQSALSAIVATGSEAAARHLFDRAQRRTIEEHIAELLTEASESSRIPLVALVRAMGGLRYRPVVPWLIQLLEGLNASESKDGNVPLQDLWEETVRALGRIGDSKALAPLMVTLTSSEIVVPIRALGELGATEAVHRLLPSLESGDDFVVFETLSALSGLPSQEAFDGLSKYLVSGRLAGVAEADQIIIRALSAIDPRGAEGFALDQLHRSDLPDGVAWRCLRLLQHVATEASIEILFAYLRDERYYEPAADILAREIATSAVFKEAEGRLPSEDSYERAGALHIMCHRWGASLDTKLGAFERDPAPEVRLVVAMQYWGLKNKTGRHRLLRMAMDGHPEVRDWLHLASLESPLSVIDGGWLCRDREIHRIESMVLGDLAVIAFEERDREEPEPRTSRVFVLEPSHCHRAAVANLVEGKALYLGIHGPEGEERWLFYPQAEPPGRVQEHLVDFCHKLMGLANHDLGPPTLTSEEAQRIQDLEVRLRKAIEVD